jgi:hypothetical protein
MPPGLYHVFSLSLQDVELLLLERGIVGPDGESGRCSASNRQCRLSTFSPPAVSPGSTQERNGIPSRATASAMITCG